MFAAVNVKKENGKLTNKKEEIKRVFPYRLLLLLMVVGVERRREGKK